MSIKVVQINQLQLRSKALERIYAQNGKQHEETEDISFLRNFCSNSSIQALKYLVPEIHLIEKCVWLLGLALGIGSCGMLVMQTWSRWRSSTVIKQRSISDVPFPAVTVCPGLTVDLDRLRYDEYLQQKEMKNVTKEKLEIIRDLMLVCPRIDNDELNLYLDSTRTHKAIDTIEKYAVQMKEYIHGLNWKGQKQSAQYFMKPIATEMGICYSSNTIPGFLLFENNTFHSDRNYLDIDFKDKSGNSKTVQWSPGFGYEEGSDIHAYPTRALGVGKEQGLELTFHRKPLPLRICSKNEGLTIMIHNPGDIPRPDITGVEIPGKTLMEFAVTPVVIWTDDRVRRSYSPSERQCFYPDERRLRFFKQYTQANCEFECLANFTLRLCGCVGFHMPRIQGTPLCTPYEGYFCMEFAAWRMHRLQSKLEAGPEDNEAYSFLTMTKEEEKQMYCNCLQTCNSVGYRIEVLFADQMKNETWHVPGVKIYFQTSHYIPTLREEVFGKIDFIANCGGILGLCLGFNLQTLVEIFYYLAVQPLINKLKWNKITSEPQS